MPIVLDDIPEITQAVDAAVRREEELRELPFLIPTVLIAGIEIYHLTPLTFNRLIAGRSPFLCGGEPTEEATIHFLWTLSPHFCEDPSRRDDFIKALSGLEWQEIAFEIFEYIEEALMDRPCGAGSKKAPIASFSASLVHTIATAYGWSRVEILKTPIAELYQYLRMIEREHNHKAAFINRLSDKIRRTMLAEWKRKKAEEAAPKQKRARKKGALRK